MDVEVVDGDGGVQVVDGPDGGAVTVAEGDGGVQVVDGNDGRFYGGGVHVVGGDYGGGVNVVDHDFSGGGGMHVVDNNYGGGGIHVVDNNYGGGGIHVVDNNYGGGVNVVDGVDPGYYVVPGGPGTQWSGRKPDHDD